MINRRGFLQSCAALGAACAFPVRAEETQAAGCRAYHLSISVEALEAEPERIALAQRAGVSTLWLAGFFYGYWPYPPEKIQAWRRRIEAAGMQAQVINIPLGHPGDSLGSSSGTLPLTPPLRWRVAVRPDGSTYAGTSLHPPATEENAKALQTLRELGVKRVFVDDDFRLARGPGVIGGCFCGEHRDEFLKTRGLEAKQWDELLACVQERRLSPVLRAWVDYTCDQLTGCFRAQQQAVPEIELGNMVMYFGAEKAGIRLADYRNVPVRVGEMMFDDKSFGQLKNKTAELFSCLFHRRFISPERAYSETTAYPSDRLSAKNMAGKLAVSTIADVRNTMFMSGASAFPAGHWDVLGPAMQHHAKIHARLAGHVPRGPFKHFWGEASRYVGDDDPFSLFLAAGVPFEVTDSPAAEGYTFLADADVPGAAGGRGLLFARPGDSALPQGIRPLEESLPALFALKREMAPALAGVPHVEEEKPVVCAWYPSARAVLLWNLAETREHFTVRLGETRREVDVEGLDVALLTEVG